MTFADFCGQELIGVSIQHLPKGVRGFCIRVADGYTIILSDQLDEYNLRSTLNHELQHIIEGHFDLPEDEAERRVREHPAIYEFD
jgi:hypothetical protein